jgi:hypothetical protein
MENTNHFLKEKIMALKNATLSEVPFLPSQKTAKAIVAGRIFWLKIFL